MASRRHVLVVATHPDSALRDGLEDAGFAAPWFASSPADQDRVLDLIVVDVESGHEDHLLRLCRRLSHQHAAVPLLMIVDPDHGYGVDALFAAGATDVLCRPYTTEDLTIRARVALRLGAERRRGATRERRLVEETARLERKTEDLSKLVYVDALTGLMNRHYASILLNGEWRRAARARVSLAIVIADLDHFHDYNERFGHLGGDACLRQVSAAMAGCLRRPTDFLARYGGEELVAVLASTDAAGAHLVAERLRRAVHALSIPHPSAHGRDVVTVSLGFAACIPVEGRSVDHLLAVADAALFQAKAQGRDRVCGELPVPAMPPTGRDLPPGTRFPVVTVDPSLVDRVPAFLAEAQAETRVLAEALVCSNFDRIRLLGHRLQVTARDSGLEEIAELGARLDISARDSDVATLSATIADLAAYVDRVQVVYRRATDP